MVEILASGQVVSGSGASAGAGSKAAQSKSSLLVEGAIILVLVAFEGYVLGFISRSRKDATSKNRWTPVKTQDI
ncbi:putative inactive purple acid phosphatase 9 [Quercus suber]|uniref:Inactive purple acid phosphatase 9 n=1 Tax=Quercus suber TaxID=58331 RepID=A0AAW0J103_QUESU|nr:putative inactive purple acid phosphatase 9 [Quercus suber]